MTSFRAYSVLVLLVSALPLWIWYQQIGELGIYLDPVTPPGQLPYILSKLVGMYALFVVTLQVIIALFCKVFGYQSNRLMAVHKYLGIGIMLFSFGHVLLFFAAATLRNEKLAWSLFVPNFKDYFHTYVTLGLAALGLLLVIVIFGFMRSSMKHKAYKVLHKAYWLAIGLIYLHSFAIGSDVQTLPGLVLYYSLATAVGILSVVYLAKAARMQYVPAY